MSVLEGLLDEFKGKMLAKFWARVEKHPGESSVTDDKYDWAGSNIADGEHHLLYEFLERFPQYIPRFPEVDPAHITVDPPEIEDVDLANLAFYDWAVRKAKASKETKKP